MADLDERFRSLSRTGSPDLWSDIETREPRQHPPERTPGSRLAAAVVALIVAIAGSLLAIRTFDRVDQGQPPLVSGQERIVFVGDGGDARTDLYSMLPDGSDVRRLTRTSPSEEEPVWSPDATEIAYSLRQEGEPASYVIGFMRADGSGRAEVAGTRLESRIPVGSPSWSPRDDAIVFAAFGEGGGIYVTPLGGDSAQRLTTAGPPTIRVDSDPVWSPDGRSIAFIRWILGDLDTPSEQQIVRMNADGSNLTTLARFPSDAGSGTGDVEVGGLSWSPDGTRLAFTSLGNVYMLEIVGGEPETVVACESLGCGGGTNVLTDSTSWSPDGSRLAFTAWLDVPSNRAEPPMIYVADLATASATLFATGVGGLSPSWAPVIASDADQGPPPTAEVVETLEVGEVVSSVSYGERSVWVATSNNDGSFGGRIVRIDPATHEVQAEIQVDVLPTWEVGGGAMVVEDGSLWVTGSLEASGAFDDPGGGAEAAVIRIDTTTNEVAQTFELGGTHGADLTFLDGELWVLVFGDESVDNDMEVVRVDPVTGDVLARIPLGTGWAHTVVAADDRLVVLESGPGAANAAGRAAVIDPNTNAVSRVEVPGEYITPMPVVSRDQVWVSLDPGFARLDPQAVAFPDPEVSLPPRFSDCCGFVEADDRGIWFLNLAANGKDRALNLFDPGTGEVRELVVLEEGAPVAMAVAPDSVWILNYEGTLTHVALG